MKRIVSLYVFLVVLGMCFCQTTVNINNNGGSGCNQGRKNEVLEYIEFGETDTLIRRVPGTASPGDVDIFTNRLYLANNSTFGVHDGVCTLLNFLDRWNCVWDVRVNEIDTYKMSGTVWDEQNKVANIAVVGGTGKYRGVSGSGTIYSNGVFNQGTYWFYRLEISY